MKKVLALLVAVLLLFGMSACNNGVSEKITSLDQLEGKKVVINGLPMETEKARVGLKEAFGVLAGSLVITDSVSQSVMMVKNGQADAAAVSLYSTAKYFEKRNDDLLALESKQTINLTMIGRNEEQGLVNSIDAAITTLKANGKLDTLVTEWIKGDDIEELKSEDVPTIEEAETIKVGISGDALPLDYVSADGKAAGFNVALMTEISKIINKNVVFVVLSTDSRLAAVKSGQIDIFFWHATIVQLPEDISQTQIYYKESSGVLVKK